MWRVTRWAPQRKVWVRVEEVPDEHTAASRIRALAAQGHLSRASLGKVTLTAYPFRPSRPLSFCRHEFVTASTSPQRPFAVTSPSLHAPTASPDT